MIKVIASDLDGTLVNKKHLISEMDAEAVRAAQKAGIEFLAVTGRSWEQAIVTLEQADIRCDSILLCGSEVRDREGNVLERKLLSYEDVEMILEEAGLYEIPPFLFTEEGDYVLGTAEDHDSYSMKSVRHYFRFVGTDEEVRATEIYKENMMLKRIESIEKIKKKRTGILKVSLLVDGEDDLRVLMDKFGSTPTLAVGCSAARDLEVTAAEAQKGLRLQKLIESRGYTADEVMVLGDSLNDLSMLCGGFGVSVAVDNAMDEVKRAVTHLTKSNDDNGVAYVIEKLLAGQLDDLKK